MLLAQARKVQKYEVAEIKTQLLATQAGGKPAKRQGQPKEIEHTRMERANRLGVSTERTYGFGRETSSLSGERMRSIELFTGAGGLALGIEKAGFHHEVL